MLTVLPLFRSGLSKQFYRLRLHREVKNKHGSPSFFGMGSCGAGWRQGIVCLSVVLGLPFCLHRSRTHIQPLLLSVFLWSSQKNNWTLLLWDFCCKVIGIPGLSPLPRHGYHFSASNVCLWLLSLPFYRPLLVGPSSCFACLFFLFVLFFVLQKNLQSASQ